MSTLDLKIFDAETVAEDDSFDVTSTTEALWRAFQDAQEARKELHEAEEQEREAREKRVWAEAREHSARECFDAAKHRMSLVMTRLLA